MAHPGIPCARVLASWSFLASVAAWGQQSPPPPPENLPSNEIIRPDSASDERFHEMQRRMNDQRRSSPDGVKFKLSRTEAQKISSAESLISAKKYKEAAEALQQASAQAKSADARYVVAALRLQLAQETGDAAMMVSAIEDALATGKAPETAQRSLLRNQGVLALEAKDFAKAEAALSRLSDLDGGKADNIVLLAEAKAGGGKSAEALQLFEKAIGLRKAAGEPVPPSWDAAAASLRGTK